MYRMTGFNGSQAVQAACVALRDGAAEGGIAALVDGMPVYVGQVERYVSVFRSMAGLGDDGEWRAWLAGNGTDEHEVRRDTLSFLIDFRLMERAALERGAVVPASDVDAQLESAAAMLGGWDALERSVAERGLTMELFRRGVEANLSRSMLIDQITAEYGGCGCLGRDGPETGARSAEEAFDRWYSGYRASASIVVT